MIRHVTFGYLICIMSSCKLLAHGVNSLVKHLCVLVWLMFGLIFHRLCVFISSVHLCYLSFFGEYL